MTIDGFHHRWMGESSRMQDTVDPKKEEPKEVATDEDVSSSKAGPTDLVPADKSKSHAKLHDDHDSKSKKKKKNAVKITRDDDSDDESEDESDDETDVHAVHYKCHDDNSSMMIWVGIAVIVAVIIYRS